MLDVSESVSLVVLDAVADSELMEDSEVLVISVDDPSVSELSELSEVEDVLGSSVEVGVGVSLVVTSFGNPLICKWWEGCVATTTASTDETRKDAMSKNICVTCEDFILQPYVSMNCPFNSKTF